MQPRPPALAVIKEKLLVTRELNPLDLFPSHVSRTAEYVFRRQTRFGYPRPTARSVHAHTSADKEKEQSQNDGHVNLLLVFEWEDRKSTRLNSSHGYISYA